MPCARRRVATRNDGTCWTSSEGHRTPAKCAWTTRRKTRKLLPRHRGEGARSASLSSGAQSGARVADYLRGEGEAKPAADKLLERLTLPTAAQKADEPKPVSTAPAVSETKLAELTRPSQLNPRPRRYAAAGGNPRLRPGFEQGQRQTVVAAGWKEAVNFYHG